MHRLFIIPAFAAALLVWMGCSALSTQTAGAQQDAEDGFVPLFDGKTFDGWHKVGGNAQYHIEDGEIIGVCQNSHPNTFLRTDKTYTDFEFRCEFKWDVKGNSGIQYRSHQKPNKDGKPVGQVFGYQYELDPSDRAWTAGLYEEGRRGWLYDLKGDEKKDKREAVKLDDWNQIVIRCEGNHIRTWLNGVAIVDYVDEADEALMEGFIALQVHNGREGKLRWRNLRIKELDK